MVVARIFSLIGLIWLCVCTESGLIDAQVQDNEDCVSPGYAKTISPAVRSIICAIDSGLWYIPPNAPALVNSGCLLGNNRCAATMHIPTESEVPVSPPPPDAKNAEYQKLATIAEKVVPQTWWRKGFSDEKLLLTANSREFPRKMFDNKVLSNKKLRNIYECVTRQQFIRKSFDFNTNAHANLTSNAKGLCQAMEEDVVKRFYEQWMLKKDHLDGTFQETSSSSNTKSTVKLWLPNSSGDGQLLVGAHEVLDYFYGNHGGIWTGCFAFDHSSGCRGALAGKKIAIIPWSLHRLLTFICSEFLAAALVVATHLVADIAGRKKSFTESQFVRGYILASLGRGLLHGDTGTTGDRPLTVWRLRPIDFIALQQGFLKLYIDSFGALYNKQLDNYIPMAFAPDFQVQSDQSWKQFASSIEPVYTSIRNWMYTEASTLIDFGPYRPLVAFADVRKELVAKKCRRVLIDVGANGFFASPKYLIDSYAPYLPFTDVIMIEPEPHFSATVPKAYSQRYNIQFLQIYAEVATGSETDMIKLLPKLVTKDDFVVLKFDVDPNR